MGQQQNTGATMDTQVFLHSAMKTELEKCCAQRPEKAEHQLGRDTSGR